jgi:hypothetical protein
VAAFTYEAIGGTMNQRQSTPSTADQASTIAALQREVEALGSRVTITRIVAQDLSVYVSADEVRIKIVVDDVLAKWAEDAPGTGAAAFWRAYANCVEWADLNGGDEYRAEFCPPEGEPFDDHAYFAAVWADHSETLRLAALLRHSRSRSGWATAG